MFFYQCNLILHDNVFFATREMGILFETEKYLHNWALSYAFFAISYIPQPYRQKGINAQKPAYLDNQREQNLLCLNQAQIYVFPAKPIQWSYQVNTFKAAQTSYYGKSKQFGDKGAERNYPINYGRAKELAVGSQYLSYILSADKITIPQWIRLGKWASKIQVQTKLLSAKTKSGRYHCNHPLNPLDLPNQSQLLLYNRIVMPPVSLVSQAEIEGDYWELEDHTKLPKGAGYGLGRMSNAS